MLYKKFFSYNYWSFRYGNSPQSDDSAWRSTVLFMSLVFCFNSLGVIFVIAGILKLQIFHPITFVLFWILLPTFYYVYFCYILKNGKKRMIIRQSSIPVEWKWLFWLYFILSKIGMITGISIYAKMI